MFFFVIYFLEVVDVHESILNFVLPHVWYPPPPLPPHTHTHLISSTSRDTYWACSSPQALQSMLLTLKSQVYTSHGEVIDVTVFCPVP